MKRSRPYYHSFTSVENQKLCEKREIGERESPVWACSQSGIRGERREECWTRLPHYERGHRVNFISVISRLTECQLVNGRLWLSVCTASSFNNILLSPSCDDFSSLLWATLGPTYVSVLIDWHGAIQCSMGHNLKAQAKAPTAPCITPHSRARLLNHEFKGNSDSPCHHHSV